MYKNIHYDKFNNTIHLWDDIEGYSKFEYQPYAYSVDPNGDQITIDGHKVKKVKQWSKSAEELNLVYEHDVNPIIRTLIDRYYDSDDISIDFTTLFLDIEVAKEGSYSTVEDADNTITAISFKSSKEDVYYCLLLDTNRLESEYDGEITIDLSKGSKTVKAKYFTFKSEFNLLKVFLREYLLIKPDCISGWNVEWYDMPYLYNRITKILGKDYADGLSPLKKCHARNTGDFNQLRLYISGVSILDYLTLYKKFTYSEQPNYKLDTISKKELGRGKVEYDGDLQKLYETDIKKFAEYNIIDVELISSLDEKLQLLEIARSICHKGHVPYEDFIYPSKYLDGASLVYCKRNGLIASSNKADKGSDDPAEGAFVKMPQTGLHRWVIDLDLESLYPGNIRTLNISPETKFGRILNYKQDDYTSNKDRKYYIELIKDNTVTGQFSDFGSSSNKVYLKNSEELKSYIEKNNLSLSSNGILYDLSKPGLIPSILTLWFKERKDYQALKSKYTGEGNKELEQLYDKKQLVTKILLNSFYGVLLLKTFRFYDKENGEAVTTTGKSVISFSMKATNHFYAKETGITEDYCIYGDTDSLFFSSIPIIESRYGKEENYTDEELSNYSLEVANDVQKYINAAYDIYAKKFHNVDKHVWFIKQELVGRRALWLDAKKRYAIWIVNEKGQPKNKIDVKGIDVVRSSFPKDFREFTKQVLSDILHDEPKEKLNKKVEEFGKLIKTSYIKDIMMPTGVKEVKKWNIDQGFIKGTPVHVKASMNYNRLLNYWQLKSFPKISDGDKILWCYLKKNEFNLESIALTGDDPVEVEGFVTKYIDRDDLFENTLKNKLQTFWDALGWGAIVTNSNVNKFFKFS